MNHALELMAREIDEGAETVDVIAVLDCDHVPLPRFLTATLGWFDDPGVALVQAPQTYYNSGAFDDDGDTGEQGMFFHVLLPARNHDGAGPFWCGSTSLIRLTALQRGRRHLHRHHRGGHAHHPRRSSGPGGRRRTTIRCSPSVLPRDTRAVPAAAPPLGHGIDAGAGPRAACGPPSGGCPGATSTSTSAAPCGGSRAWAPSSPSSSRRPSWSAAPRSPPHSPALFAAVFAVMFTIRLWGVATALPRAPALADRLRAPDPAGPRRTVLPVVADHPTHPGVPGDAEVGRRRADARTSTAGAVGPDLVDGRGAAVRPARPHRGGAVALRPGVDGRLAGSGCCWPVWCSSSAPGASRPRRTRPRDATRTASPSRPPSRSATSRASWSTSPPAGLAVRVPKGTLSASAEVEVALPGAAPIEPADRAHRLGARRLLRRRLAPDPVRRLDGVPDAVALALPHTRPGSSTVSRPGPRQSPPSGSAPRGARPPCIGSTDDQPSDRPGGPTSRPVPPPAGPRSGCGTCWPVSPRWPPTTCCPTGCCGVASTRASACPPRPPSSSERSIHRPARPLPWRLMAGGLLLWAVADSVGSLLRRRARDRHVPDARRALLPARLSGRGRRHLAAHPWHAGPARTRPAPSTRHSHGRPSVCCPGCCWPGRRSSPT